MKEFTMKWQLRRNVSTNARALHYKRCSILVPGIALLFLSGGGSGLIAQDDRGIGEAVKSIEAYVRGDVDHDASEKSATMKIESLRSHGGDFQKRISLSLALLNRSSARWSKRDFAGAEADLLERLNLGKGLKDSREDPYGVSRAFTLESSYYGLANLYLATGNLNRAVQAFDAAVFFRDAAERGLNEAKIESNYTELPPWAKSEQILNTSGPSDWISGPFLKKIGRYEEALSSFQKEIRKIDDAWAIFEPSWKVRFKEQAARTDQLADQAFRGAEKDYAEVWLNYWSKKALREIEAAEILLKLDRRQESIEACERAISAAEKASSPPVDIEEKSKAPPFDLKNLAGLPPSEVEKMKGFLELASALDGMHAMERNQQSHVIETTRAAAIFFEAGAYERAFTRSEKGVSEIKPDSSNRFALPLVFSNSTIDPAAAFRLHGDIEAALKRFDEAKAAYESAKKFAEIVYPENHPEALRIEEHALLLEAMKEESPDRGEIANQVRELVNRKIEYFDEMLSLSDEEQRLAFRTLLDPWSLPANLGEKQLLAETVFRTKGAILDSVMKDQELFASISDSAREELRKLQQVWMERQMQGGTQAVEDAKALKRLIDQRKNAARSAADSGADEKSEKLISVESIQSALPSGAVLLEYIQYLHYEAPGKATTRYGVIVLEHGKEPEFISLGSREEIDHLIARYGGMMRQATSDEEARSILTALESLILSPALGSVEPEVNQLLVSPDGAMNFLSFATFLDSEEQFLGQRYQVSYLSSGRDLLRPQSEPDEQSVAIFASPDYSSRISSKERSDPAAGLPLLAGLRGVLAGMEFPPLPGTAEEADRVRKIVQDQWHWSVSGHFEEEATEENFFRNGSRGIIHFATHGFFLPEIRGGSKDSGIGQFPGYDTGETGITGGINLRNPMHRSGLALAGANVTMREWNEGTVLDTANDGILSAQELSLADLKNTWLVVLSACDTGLGEAPTGESVLGLRRGLIQAGAEQLLLTLWPVADRETADFMAHFYEKLGQNFGDPSGVMAQTQLHFLDEYRSDRGLASAVRLAGPFVFSR